MTKTIETIGTVTIVITQDEHSGSGEVYNSNFDIKVSISNSEWGDDKGTWVINWGGHGDQNTKYAYAYGRLILKAVEVCEELNSK